MSPSTRGEPGSKRVPMARRRLQRKRPSWKVSRHNDNELLFECDGLDGWVTSTMRVMPLEHDCITLIITRRDDNGARPSQAIQLRAADFAGLIEIGQKMLDQMDGWRNTLTTKNEEPA